MKTININTLEKFEASNGKEYGHVPGHQYHDVQGTLQQTKHGWRCELVEVWGSAQGRDEEHGRKTASGRAGNPIAAVERAKAEAKEIGMEWRYVAATCNDLLKQVE
jgi:hypothetical protein